MQSIRFTNIKCKTFLLRLIKDFLLNQKIQFEFSTLAIVLNNNAIKHIVLSDYLS